MSRSRFDRSHSVKTSFNVGDLVPFFVEEVLPGDTFTVDTSKVVRTPSLITPIMDNLYLDTYYFFVPNRLVWEHWQEFCGENKASAWIPNVDYQIPQITSPAGSGWNVGTIADYMGIPTGVPGLSVNALPFRAYALICNEWFRDENLSDPVNVPVDDVTVAGVNSGVFVSDVAKGGLPYKAAKYHDYFTSALPSPQKGPDVAIPLTQSGYLPVTARGETIPILPGVNNALHFTSFGAPTPSVGNSRDFVISNVASGTSAGVLGGLYATAAGDQSATTSNTSFLAPDNLWAYTGNAAAVATINQLRLAFQIQKFYERQARGGTRYIEILKAHFGVTSPDSRLQRPEYLGGNRLPINISQVVQQSETASTPQGTPTGISVTSDRHSDFTHSFVEHGFLIGVMVARYDHTYQQGLDRFWSRKDIFDFYWPAFANIGEMAILNKEIYAQGSSVDDEVFGYQEAWADYRYKPNHVTGQMRSQYAQSLDVWHLADYYDQLPTLSSEWIFEDSAVVDRVLAVSSRLANQLFADIYIRNIATRPMPLYSIPGLIDHH